MFQLKLSKRARADLREIKHYIGKRTANTTLGRDYSEKLIMQCEKLAANPFQMGAAQFELGYDIRSFPFENYIIYLRYRDDLMEVISILERHRDSEAQFEED